MSDLPEICPECGNDEVAEGFDLCSDCLETGAIPEDSWVVWCRECFSTLMWTLADACTYQSEEWGYAVNWAIHEAHPENHPGLLE